MSTLLIGAGSFLRLRFCRRRKTSQKIITSDHRGFAGVQLPAMLPPPASIRSPELSSQAQSCPPMSAPLIGADTPRGISPLFKKTPARQSSSEFFSNMDDAFLNLCSALGVHFAVFAVADVLFVHFRQHKDRFDLDVDQRQQQDKIHW